MVDKTLSRLVGGGGGLPKLAPNLTSISDQVVPNLNYTSIVGLVLSASLTTAISLTGKFAIGSLGFNGTGADSYNVVMIIDGVAIVDDTFTGSTSGINLLNAPNGVAVSTQFANGIGAGACDSTLLVQISSPTDTSVNFNYDVRPIL